MSIVWLGSPKPGQAPGVTSAHYSLQPNQGRPWLRRVPAPRCLPRPVSGAGSSDLSFLEKNRGRIQREDRHRERGFCFSWRRFSRAVAVRALMRWWPRHRSRVPLATGSGPARGKAGLHDLRPDHGTCRLIGGEHVLHPKRSERDVLRRVRPVASQSGRRGRKTRRNVLAINRESRLRRA